MILLHWFDLTELPRKEDHLVLLVLGIILAVAELVLTVKVEEGVRRAKVEMVVLVVKVIFLKVVLVVEVEEVLVIQHLLQGLMV